MIHITDKKNCCGCSACVQRCPKQCISLTEDEEGFLYPYVNEESCVECGLCEKICPILNPQEETFPLQVIAAKNTNTEERLGSSSGGLFLPLAKSIINEGVLFSVLIMIQIGKCIMSALKIYQDFML